MSGLPKKNVRGVKRKRQDDIESEEDKGAKLRRKLYHALKELRRVIKKARTFEVQKTLKKLKGARCGDPESDLTKDLEAQMEVLKLLSYDQLAHSALVTKLKKDRILSADPEIRAISTELASNLVTPGAPGTPTAKVQSRILSSKVLASEVASIVETFRTFPHRLAGPEDTTEASGETHPSPGILKKMRTRIGREKIASSNESAGHTSGGDSIAEADDGWESGSVGAPSEADSGSMAGSADGRDSGSRDSDDLAFGQGSSGEAELPSEGTPFDSSKGQSEFLPFLSVGFTRGDSDSEFSDSEAKIADGIKKNRRGQRARRAIWEKKFGKNANHIKRSQQMTVRGIKRRLDPVNVDRRSEKGNSILRPHRTPIESRAPVYDPQTVRKPTDGVKKYGSGAGQKERTRRQGDTRGKQGAQPLHPSWEAKRKQKAASIVPSQGTKIVFSES